MRPRAWRSCGRGAVGECLRVDRVGLHAGGGDRSRAQRVRKVDLVAGVLEQLGQPRPAVGRLDGDPRLAFPAGEQRQEWLAVVDDPPRQRQLALPVDHRDLRGRTGSSSTPRVAADLRGSRPHDRVCEVRSGAALQSRASPCRAAHSSTAGRFSRPLRRCALLAGPLLVLRLHGRERPAVTGDGGGARASRFPAAAAAAAPPPLLAACACACCRS